MSSNPSFYPVSEMEADIKDVRRWAGVLTHMAEGLGGEEGEQLHAVSNVLFALGDRLRKQWADAFEAAGGKA